MDSSKKSVKLFLIVFLIIFIFFTATAVILRMYNENKYPGKFNELETKVEENDFILPQILNSPVEGVFVGEDFVFVPRLVPAQTDAELILVESPEWMEIEGDMISGIANETGTFKFVLRIAKNEQSYDNIYYLVVENE